MKYGNRKTKIDGIAFDSAMEAGRYAELKTYLRAGIIQDLELQKEFELVPAFVKNGKKYRAIVYKCDFYYYDGKKHVVEDVKGCKTPVYQLKKKLFEWRYPDLTLTEITRKDLRR